jgi:uncharacterized protein (UPF0335 family)
MTEAFATGALCQFVKQIEGINADLDILQTDKAELFKAAKQQGLDPAVLKRVISERRKDPQHRAEQDELFQLYWDAVSAEPVPGLSRVREEDVAA